VLLGDNLGVAMDHSHAGCRWAQDEPFHQPLEFRLQLALTTVRVSFPDKSK